MICNQICSYLQSMGHQTASWQYPACHETALKQPVGVGIPVAQHQLLKQRIHDMPHCSLQSSCLQTLSQVARKSVCRCSVFILQPAKGLASPSRIMYQYEDMGATAVIQSSMTTKGKLGTNSLVPGKNSSASQVAGAAANLVPGTSPVRVVLGATDTPTVEHFRDQVG